MVGTKFDRRALSEVYEVIIMLEDKELKKIPTRLIEAIKLNKDNDYEVDFQNIEEGNMLSDTIKILSTLYTYYLASEEEKSVIFKVINNPKEQYQINYPIFKNKQIETKEENKEQSMVVVKKENLIRKILNKIKRFFL